MSEEELKESGEEDVLDEVWDDRSIWNEGDDMGSSLTELDRWDTVARELLPETGPRPKEEPAQPQPVVDLKAVRPKQRPPIAPVKAADPEQGPTKPVSDKQLLMLIQKYKEAEKICEMAGISLQTLQQRVGHLSYRIKRYIDVEGLYRDTGPVKMTREGILIPKGHLIDTGFKAGDQFNVTFKDRLIILARLRKPV